MGSTPISRIDPYRMLAKRRKDDWTRRKVEEAGAQQGRARGQATGWWVRQMQGQMDPICTTATPKGGAWTPAEGTEGTLTPTESVVAVQDAGEPGKDS